MIGFCVFSCIQRSSTCACSCLFGVASVLHWHFIVMFCVRTHRHNVHIYVVCTYIQSSMQPWGCEADMAGGHASCISTLIRGGAAEDTVSNSAAPMSPQHSAYSIAERSAAAVTGQTALPSGMGSGLPQPAALPTQANGQEKVTKAYNQADAV